MSANQNKQLLQRIFAGLAQGDSRLFVESMAEDFRWHMIGSTAWSKTYEGKQVVLTELFGKLRLQFADRIKTMPQRFIAEDDFVVVEARGNNLTTKGIVYNNTYCFIFRLADGKLQDVTEYLDTELVTAALGA